MFQLTKNKGRKLRWRVIAAENFQPDDVFAFGSDLERKQRQIFAYVLDAFAHESLDREDRVLRLFDHFLLRRITDNGGSTLIKIDDRRYERAAVSTRKHTWCPIFDNRDQAVCGSQIDSYNLRHYLFLQNTPPKLGGVAARTAKREPERAKPQKKSEQRGGSYWNHPPRPPGSVLLSVSFHSAAVLHTN